MQYICVTGAIKIVDDYTKSEYYFRWNFSNFYGAIDGKHIVIWNASHDGSEYVDYKGTFSAILLACIDAMCFRYFNIGTNGKAKYDAAVFAKHLNNTVLKP